MISTAAFSIVLLAVLTEQIDLSRIRRQCPCAQIVANPCSCQIGLAPQCNCVQPVYQYACPCGFLPQTALCQSQCQQSCMGACSGNVVTSCPSLCQNTCFQSCAPQPTGEIRLVMPMALAVSGRCVPVCQQACATSCLPGLHVANCVPICKESCQRKCGKFALVPIEDCPISCRPSCSADCVSKASKDSSKVSAAESRIADEPAQVSEAAAPSEAPSSALSDSNLIEEVPELPLTPFAPDASAAEESLLSTFTPSVAIPVTSEFVPETAAPQGVTPSLPISDSSAPGVPQSLETDIQAAPASEISAVPQVTAHGPTLPGFSLTPAGSLPLCIKICMPSCDPKCIRVQGLSSSNLTVGQSKESGMPSGIGGQQLATGSQSQQVLAPLPDAPGHPVEFGNGNALNREMAISQGEVNVQESSAPAAMPAKS